MDSTGGDSDDDVVISESSFSEDSFIDFSEDIVLSQAHSTMRPSSLRELIECNESSEGDEESGSHESLTSTSDEESIVEVRKSPTTKRRVLRIVSSDEESVSEVDSKNSRGSGCASLEGSGVKELEESLGKVSIKEASGIEFDSDTTDISRKLKDSSEKVSDQKEPEDSIERIPIVNMSKRKSGAKKSVGAKEANDSLPEVSVIESPQMKSYIKASAGVREVEDSLPEVSVLESPQMKSYIKASCGVKEVEDSLPEVSVIESPQIRSYIKASVGVKEVEDSLENVTIIDTSNIQDYTNDRTRIRSSAAAMKLPYQSVTTMTSPLKKDIAEGSRASYRRTVDVSDSDSSSDEEHLNSYDSDVERGVEDISVFEVAETISKVGIGKEKENVEAGGSPNEKLLEKSPKELPKGKDISEKSPNESLIGNDLLKKLPKESGRIWVQPEFQTAENLPRAEQQVEHPPADVKEMKSEFKKPEGKLKLPTEKQLRAEVDSLQKDVLKLRMTLMTVDVSKLPDQGMRLRMKLQDSEKILKEKEKALAEKAFIEDDGEAEAVGRVVVKPAVPHRLPIGFGMQALKTQIREKTLTEEALHQLHGSINSCPAENVFAEDSRGLKSSVQLMPHQKHALAWLMWRETQKPSAGILADDMGLGKTLTMISLILKCKEEGMDDADNDKEGDGDDDDDDDEQAGGNWLSRGKKKWPQGGTLVVCPASLILQWEEEIKKHCKRNVLSVEIHHGARREDKASRLARNDVVITTYSIVRNSCGKADRGVLHQVMWRRIILDEAHVVRNHKSQQSMAVCSLRGKKRWALTGTPVHNKELDLYALLKFLRVTPFDDYSVWHRWVDSKNAAGLQRLNTVIQAIMLRRTKEQLQSKGELKSLPDKKTEDFTVRLNEEELKVYSKVLVFSKTLFAQFLHQRAEKENMMNGNPFFPTSKKKFQVDAQVIEKHPELANMFKKMSQMRDIRTHQILVLLLRLRQICCHPGLIKAMLDDETKEMDGIEDQDGLDIDILAQFRGMSLKESSSENNSTGEMNDQINVLTTSNPVFDLSRISSKMKKVFDVLEARVLHTSDKAVIVSQWTSMLGIIHDHLKQKGVSCQILSGSVKVTDRMDVVNEFNKEGRGFQVLLLSLTAGGVGLNLIGGNHLFMIDLHWNPQLECQAFDRVYRVGQKKNVFVYKFMCEETIEQRIKALQESKLALASSVLSGSMKKSNSKLTLQDLKTLFSM